MDAERWQRVQAVFHDAADLPAAEQLAFLHRACGDDAALLADVRALLAEDARGDSILDRGVAHAAHRVLGGGAAAPLPTEAFGAYRITRVLGEGGMGVVYLAERSDLGSVAAIKILRDAWLSPARRERFASEQRTLAQLNHPLIARLLDADTLADGTPWFVMEYVEGEPLTAYCDAHALPVAERLALFRRVCEAVQHAHLHAVIHRDLKPSNILVTADGTVKLLDFGIAKHVEALDGPAEHTQTGLRLMTPAYAAPEQVRGGRVGVHTDVYALGVILYELLAGRLPFDLSSLTPGEAVSLVAEREPPRPSLVAREGAASPLARGHPAAASRAEWADLDVLVLTAMHKDPERRYRTVDALVRDIDHFLEGEPLEARPDSARYRLAKYARRNWRALTAAAVALAAVLVLTVSYAVGLATARNAALTEAARAQRIQRFTMNLFEGGDKSVGPSDTLRVLALVDRGVQQARALDAEPAAQAELYGTLGSIYQKLGNLARADTLLRAALDKRTTLFPAGSPEVVGSRVELGLLRTDQAKFEEAEKLIREGLDAARGSLPPTHPALAQATFALGRVLQERGKYADAITVGEEAARLYGGPGGTPGAAGSPTDLAATLSQLADDHFYLGHYDVSDSLNQRVLAMYRQLYGERYPLVAEILANLGASQQDRGHYDKAEAFHRQALAIFEGFYGPDHPQTAYVLTHLGRALVFEKKFDEGERALQRSLAIRERVFGPFHPLVASTVNELGNAAMAHERLDDAEARFTRMVDIYRKVYGDTNFRMGIALSNLATVYVARKQYARAERLYRDVIRIHTTALSPTHVNTGIARIKLGRALLRQNRFAEAAQESLAGYEILEKQTDPLVSFLHNARMDLAAAYDSLHQPEKAARFHEELAKEKK